MEHDSDQADSLLRPLSSQLSDYSLNSNNTLVNSPSSPPLHHHNYRRVDSAVVEEDSSDHAAGVSQHEGHGLGISSLDEQKRMSTARKSVAFEGNSGAPELLPSSMSEYRSRKDRCDDEQEETHFPGDPDLSLYQPFTANSDHEPLQKSFAPTEADFECRMRKPPENKRASRLAISILVLSIYSTIFSGIWLVIAIKKQQYGHTVSRGRVPFPTASTMFTAFAKSIELSFVTVFVTFVGQVLSKRARFQPRGVTVAEMSMRSWIVQPGTIISHWESARYAAATKLGLFALLVALMATVYTTASDALVTPVLKFGETENRLMYGKVSASFANEYYIEDNCDTPIERTADPDYYGSTCIHIEHAGQAYHNYMQYLTSWVENIKSGNMSNSMTHRPDPVGMVRIFLLV